MIRIDEIYNHTFWPWIRSNAPGARVLFCDPPGTTTPEALFTLGREDLIETDYVYFHDQEPIWPDLHEPLFDQVMAAAGGLSGYVDDSNIWHATHEPAQGHLVVSEKGEFVQKIADLYGWRVHYYFYHAWACQDWYRGYDRAYLIPRARDRSPQHTFMSPNRIVAGKRDHRVLFLYNIFRNSLQNNPISAPRICQYEQVDIKHIARKYCNIYPDIEQVFDQAELPRLFSGESEQLMASYHLTNFLEAQDSLIYVPTETVYFGNRLHITEKTFKAIALEMPFVMVAPAHSLEYLRSYGFQTFGPVLDESYDLETDPYLRIEKVVKLLKELNDLTVKERNQIHQHLLPRVEHNYNHFYRGGLTSILDQELMTMLNGIASTYNRKTI